MSTGVIVIMVLALSVGAFWFARGRAKSLSGGRAGVLHSLPGHYGMLAAIWCGLPAMVMVLLFMIFEGSIVSGMVLGSLPASVTAGMSEDQLNLALNNIRNLAAGDAATTTEQAFLDAAAYYNSLRSTASWSQTGLALVAGLVGVAYATQRLSETLRARNEVEQFARYFMIACATIAVITTGGILLALFAEAIHFFTKIPPWDFFFNVHWSPQTALRADQVASEGSFGAIPLFAGTMLITIIAMCVAVPIGLFAAIYMGEYASPQFRAFAKPVLEVLAGVPTVVYGFFAALTVAPLVRDIGEAMWLDVASESALAAGMVMGIMIIPFVSSLSDDVMNAVPKALRDGSYGLGATRSETIRNVIFPAALPGIVGAILLAVSRAIGETMIVVMAAGLAANLTLNPLDAVTTVTVQIATLLVGDQEFDSAKTLAAFALGLLLFVVTLGLNFFALRIVAKYREKYD